MRRLVVSVLISVDGRYQGPGGDLSVIPFGEAFNTHILALLEKAGTIVYGSRWFVENQRHWRAVAADPTASERDRRVADLVMTTDSLVISDAFVVDPQAPWASIARVVPRAEGPEEVGRLKRGDGGDLLMMGSGTTWSPLLQAGLVDELIVLVGPGLAGAGDALYAGAAASLALVDAVVLPDSDTLRLRYRVAEADG